MANKDAVRDILGSSSVWDMTLPWILEQQNEATLKRFWQAGYTYVSATVMDFPTTYPGILECLASAQAMVAASDDWLSLGMTVDAIDEGRKAGKLVIGFNVQNTLEDGRDLSCIRDLHRAGVRHMVLAYNVRNFVADGCAEPSDAGLSLFGRRVVQEMNRVGMVVDCSHTGRRSSLEAIDLSEGPAIFSHSGAYAVCPHIRNISDEQVLACARRGGVIGVVGIGAFLGDAEAKTETMFRHVDHIVNLAGWEHVGLGTDYVEDMSGVWQEIRASKESTWPDPTGNQLYEGDCFQPQQIEELIGMMLDRGYTLEAVRGVLGENFRRIYAAAERCL